MEKIRLLIVDDHALFRTTLKTVLEGVDHIEVVGEASNGREALDLCQQTNPEVVLLDLHLPDIDGLTVLEKIAGQSRVIALTNSHEHFQQALRAGAAGYLLKSVSVDELLDTIYRVCRGEFVVPSDAATLLVKSMRQPQDEIVSAREKEVLALMVRGLTNQQIAHRLKVSEATIKKHVSSIMAKLNASNRAAAVAIALQRGLVT